MKHNLTFNRLDYDRVVVDRYDDSPDHLIRVGEFERIELPGQGREIWQFDYTGNTAWPLRGAIKEAFNEFMESQQ